MDLGHCGLEISDMLSSVLLFPSKTVNLLLFQNCTFLHYENLIFQTTERFRFNKDNGCSICVFIPLLAHITCYPQKVIWSVIGLARAFPNYLSFDLPEISALRRLLKCLTQFQCVNHCSFCPYFLLHNVQ